MFKSTNTINSWFAELKIFWFWSRRINSSQILAIHDGAWSPSTRTAGEHSCTIIESRLSLSGESLPVCAHPRNVAFSYGVIQCHKLSQRRSPTISMVPNNFFRCKDILNMFKIQWWQEKLFANIQNCLGTSGQRLCNVEQTLAKKPHKKKKPQKYAALWNMCFTIKRLKMLIYKRIK